MSARLSRRVGRRIVVTFGVLVAVVLVGVGAGPAQARPCPDGDCSSIRYLPRWEWQQQETGFWCAPASTRIALSARGIVPSQGELARALGTTSSGTDNIGLVVNVLNRYGAGPYVRRDMPGPQVTPAQQQLLRNDLVTTINRGYALVANVVSGWRPPGYPPGRIQHYIAVVGYTDHGAFAVIADPAAGRGGFRNLPTQYAVPTAQLAAWIASKGYAARAG